MTESARYGWESDFPKFQDTSARVIRTSLHDFIEDASQSQIRAWDVSIPKLQREVTEVLDHDPLAKKYLAILEYELPMESRRPDALLLLAGAVVVLELKGTEAPSQADLDQADAYARDLRCYHRECADTPVYPVVVPIRARGYVGERSGVYVAGPDAVDGLIEEIERDRDLPPIHASAFLAAEAYCPLPSLVQAARELFHSRTIREIHRARAATDPAVSEITRIIHEAAATKTRHLVLVTGVPGSGKTLVGLQAVHTHFLDDLAIPRASGKPTAPAVFLSGNGPLVQVLQYEFKKAGGDGKIFIRGVKEYVKRYSARPGLVPPEHVVVFDEAQRAFDADQVRLKHANTPGFKGGRSEPEHFIEFAERIPEWCVVIGLIGSGQEIHVGEEAGLVQWRYAIGGCGDPAMWTVHGPERVSEVFAGTGFQYQVADALNLDTEIRFHLATDLHRYVQQVLDGYPPEENCRIAEQLGRDGYHLRITRDLETARDYLHERYKEHTEARFGLLASSKDKDLAALGIANDYQSTKRVRFGPWYGDNEGDEGNHSCRHLAEVVTEFGAQGLELDAVLLAWGTDLVQTSGKWSNAKARGYMKGAHVKDPFQLRINAYRVLLTRGRDVTVVFVPPLAELDETFAYLKASGFRAL